MATQNQRVLALLKTGPKSTHEILREVPCVVHSRIAELRQRGHEIDCARDGDRYIYTLRRGSLEKPGATPTDDGGQRGSAVAVTPTQDVGPGSSSEQLSLLGGIAA